MAAESLPRASIVASLTPSGRRCSGAGWSGAVCAVTGMSLTGPRCLHHPTTGGIGMTVRTRRRRASALDARGAVGLSHRLALGRPPLSQVDRQHSQGADRQELALPVLQGARPEVGVAQVAAPRHWVLQLLE